MRRLFWRAGGVAKVQLARLRRQRLNDDYDRPTIEARPQLAARFRGTEARTVEGFPHRLHVHSYQAARFHPAFCGGPAAVSRWLSRDDLLAALRHVGFGDVEIGLDDPAHPNGPVLALVARRAGAAGTLFR